MTLTTRTQEINEHMNILERIKSDHETQRDLMRRIEDTEGDSEKRRELYQQFKAEFEAHAAAEEHAFYAPLMKHSESTDQSRHSVAEHHEAMELIEKLDETDMSSPEWLKTFKKLVHDNDHHMEEEEDDVFALARQTLGESKLAELLEVFDDRKSEEMA
ncbi:hemerythrin domain-containing protein [Granulosicoccus sp. 3-233]|uniref:hemerythrin domain-containing protein n=1 Tax=Granulosicoccus sp. 3-233 TaxID=3417969 RepID=UPI003D3303B0